MGRWTNPSALGSLLDELREEQRLEHAQPASAEPDTRPEAGVAGPPPAASALSPFGSLLQEIRERQHLERRASLEVASARAARPARPGAPEPDLNLETRVVSQRTNAGAHARLLPLSLILHAGLFIAVIVVPLLRTPVLPAPTTATRAFFVEPSVVQPRPPPPAPRAVAPTRPRPGPTAPAEPPKFTAPIETPDEIAPEEPLDLGVPGGEPGGVAGGIAGGVVGGIVGGLPTPPPPIEPVRVGGDIREPTKLKHVEPVYPDIAVRADIHGSVILECLVSPQGRVTQVKIVRGIPLLDAAAVEAVKQWVYTPTLRDGVPVPVILTVTVKFGLQSGR